LYGYAHLRATTAIKNHVAEKVSKEEIPIDVIDAPFYVIGFEELYNIGYEAASQPLA
jgi:hypothetical protein